MPPARNNPRDLTGKQAADLAAKAAAERKARESEISLVTPVDVTPSDEVVDLTAAAKTEVEVNEGPIEVEVDESPVEFRVNTDLEQVTIGHGNHYDFFTGQKYRAPANVYRHLEEKGYIWH